MRFQMISWSIVLVIAVIAPCGLPGTAKADFIPADIAGIPANVPAFLQEFRAFLSDFSQWDTAHFDVPLMALILTPDQQRAEMLLLLWHFWMQDQASTSTGALNSSLMGSLSEVPQSGVGGTPGTTSGGGTIASLPGTTGQLGGSGDPSHGTPEPSSLTLIACGSLGLLAYRLARHFCRGPAIPAYPC